MENVRKQLVEKINSANHILVTVSRNPSVDQLASCIGLTLVLNKLGKHGTAVFSGEVPSTLEFLKPEETIEKNTDSLRDFIIALDKGKADKLRYKVEDNVVRIFITPYKTSITESDLEFTQGDFNVDLVIALGVEQQDDLDEAITSHGRILHDATVATITTGEGTALGSINWNDPKASSICEIVTELSQLLGNDVLDSQISTALLTGIVAETHRFSNDKTSPQTMSMSAALMSAGANQQLVASKLDEPAPTPPAPPAEPEVPAEPAPKELPDIKPNTDGALDITHASEAEGSESQELDASSGEAELSFDSSAFETSDEAAPATQSDHITGGGKLITEPPTLGGQLTANSQSEALDPSSDPLSQPTNSSPLLDHTELKSRDEPAELPALPELPEIPDVPPIPDMPSIPEPDLTVLTPNTPEPTPPPATGLPPAGQTLSDIESAVQSSEQQALPAAPAPETGGLNAARDEVLRALDGHDPTAPPAADPAVTSATPITDDPELAALLGQPIPTMPMPDQVPPPPPQPGPSPQADDPNAPPPVPPPIPFDFGGPKPPAA